jgi:hypothetical protein
MFACWASFPLVRLEPSFNIKTGTPPADTGDDKPNQSPLMCHNEKQHYNINFSEEKAES